METTQGNQASWNANAYQAWLNRFGQPEEAAARIKKDPAKRIGELYKYAGDSPLFSGAGSSVRRGLPPVDPGRQVDLQDFHPVSTKLISSRGTTANIRKHKVTGDYFDTSLIEKEVAYTKYLDRCAVPNAARKVRLRNWTMGEIVTSIAAEGLYVKSLEELPSLSCDGFDKGIPKSYIIVADKL
ncbi:hypothetical protein L3476_05835 [Paenibacillus thiaminolyticus]|uniref:hypothetical protein n=1 Tax=Paenibacillus thiaminolyticus TaxID=49283 RepID=UPI00234FB61D|nr:hypothetical protein [Paenibacillus thiaminolyticus]WCR30176.1 hypothetical protein L3476_05835 [Paenibacillus thiaminolyticus]